jgi:hypothetical protein
MTQWHPIFDDLLRRALQDYYEVQTNVPVGDLPREADIVVVRRSSTTRPPFRTLWRHLTPWNVFEFKGRSESARVNHIDLLVEVGLGIHRRLQEQEPDVKIRRAEISFWYLANHLGKRFLRDVIELTGNLESVSPGLWRGRILGRPLWLVSNRNVPFDRESAPVRLVSQQSIEDMRELAEILLANNELLEIYGAWIFALYPDFRKEFQTMASKQKKGDIDLGANVRQWIHEMGPQRILELGLAKQVVDDLGPDDFLAALSPEPQEELLRRLQTRKKKPVS